MDLSVIWINQQGQIIAVTDKRIALHTTPVVFGVVLIVIGHIFHPEMDAMGKIIISLAERQTMQNSYHTCVKITI